MRITFFTLIFSSLFCLKGHSQNCLPNGITFSTQADIDNFSINYPGCTVIEGDVLIFGNEITNLNGLNGLIAFGVSLEIASVPQLTSLSGLENITSIGGDLKIDSNSGLTNLSGLENIVSVGNDIYIINNSALSGLSGLESITSIGGDLKIDSNSGLTSLSGLENVTSLAGGLYIFNNNGLTSLGGLENITSVGDLIIYANPNLTSLSGLGNISSVGADIIIQELAKLTSLSGLDKITSANALTISNLPMLSSLSGLENITSVGFLNIYYNPMLTSLSGLENLASVKHLEIFVNELLTNLHGLENITSAEYVAINSCAALTSLNGLENLASAKLLVIDSNPALTNLNGLGNLTSTQEVNIHNNAALTSLSGLENLSYIGDLLYISYNQLLSDCAIFAVCDFLINGQGLIFISNNAPDCSSPVGVKAACDSRPVTATVLMDDNGTISPLENIGVSLSGNIQMNLRPTDTNGFVRFSFLESGDFVVDLPQAPNDKWNRSETRTVYPSGAGSDSTHVQLLLTPLTQCPEMTTSLCLPSNFRGCLVNSEIQVSVQNTGTAPAESVKAAVVLPPVLEVVAATPPSAAQNGDTLFFDLGDMSPFVAKNIKLTVKTDCDTFLFGHTLCVEVFAGPDSSCPNNPPGLSEVKLSAQCIGDSLVRFYLKNIGEAPTQGPHKYAIFKNENIIATSDFSLDLQETLTVDMPADGATYRMEATKFDDGTLTATAIENCRELTPGLITAFWLDRGAPEYDFDCRQVIGSYDPNQKTAVPTGTGSQGLIVANRPLQYTIDFQNTGTDTAFRVLLRDVLPPDLDVNTFRPGFSSHPCSWEINGSRLEVLFFPIALPDSNVNEPASHGFFSFTIDQKPDLPDGTNLENTASIVFDFNPPIVTNTVRHTIGQLTVRVDEARPFSNLWRVWGNPLRDAAIFRSEEYTAGEKRFELYDAAGRVARVAQFSGQEFEFQRVLLPAGLYFFRISDAQGRVFAGKIVVADQ